MQIAAHGTVRVEEDLAICVDGLSPVSMTRAAIASMVSIRISYRTNFSAYSGLHPAGPESSSEVRKRRERQT